MVRDGFRRQLDKLENDLLSLGSLVDEAVARAIASLQPRNLRLAEAVIDGDRQINRLRFEIEEECLDLMATQQPMARDLRIIVAVLILAGELERMGDHAVGIARINQMMSNGPPFQSLLYIPEMAEKASDMLRRALEAFIRADKDAALAIAREDDEVDALNSQVYHRLLGFMIKDPSVIQHATWLLWVAHNLERIADRVTNICERVVFMVTGKLVEI